jgi:hypothetical protein
MDGGNNFLGDLKRKNNKGVMPLYTLGQPAAIDKPSNRPADDRNDVPI